MAERMVATGAHITRGEASRNSPSGGPCDITFVIGQLTCGGTERQLSLLVPALAERGYTVSVAISATTSVERFLAPIQRAAQIVRLDSGPSAFRKLQRSVKLRQYIQRACPRIVHSMSFRTNWLAAVACCNTEAIGIGSVRSDYHLCRRQYGRILGVINSRWPRHQVFNSIRSATQARFDGGTSGSQIVEFVRNAVIPLNRCAGRPANGDRVQILGVGRLNRKKRWDRLVRLAARLKAGGFAVHVSLVGDGPSRQELEAEVERLDVADVFSLVGEVDDVTSLLQKTDVVVHTSAIEGAPNALMEAMAAGKAVISTNVGDASHIVIDGQTGFVVEQDDEERLYQKVSLLVSDPAMRELFGSAGRAVASREFSLERMVDSMLRVYHSAGWRDCYEANRS